MQNGQKEGKAVGVQTDGNPARIRQRTRGYQRLHLHQQGAGSFLRRQHHAPCHGSLMLRQEKLRRIGDLAQALFMHLENTQFVGRPKAVLDGAHDPVGATRLPFEIEHGIHHVFEHTRASNGSLLGHMTHQPHRGARRLGETHQACRTLPHLRHR
ncbi:hypothetical protein GGI1_09688, partial [Acidithiobacillus sp. GGI-221]